MKTAKLGVLVSGHSRGTNFQAILSAIHEGQLHAQMALLVATDAEHGAVEKASATGVKTLVLPPKSEADALAWDHRVADALYEEGVSILALAGYLRMISPVLLEAFPNRILNVHPALLPSFGGKGMYGMRVHQAVLEYGCKISGCTVHLVNERYDAGPIIAQACVPVEEDDTPETLSARVQMQEHRLFPRCIEMVIQDQIRVEGRRIRKKG
ncbi:MAG TPA: phosphoribosylglycinamide formyltransferase [Abditibacteriaceae bacterium]|jgi:phosphoribosylglycinamide formyltransferase-1